MKTLLPSSRAAAAFGPKIASPACSKRCHHAGAERRLGPDDGQVRFFARGPRDEAVKIGRRQRKIRAELPRASISRRGEKLQRGIVLAKTPHQRVLAAARAEKQYLHGDFST